MGQSEEPPDKKVALKERKSPLFIGRVLTYKIEVISDLNSCYTLWQKFSLQRNLFETWEFRFAFYLGYKYQPYFLTAKKGKEIVAFLPLWYDESKKVFTFFGSDWQEENYFYWKDKEAMKFLLKNAPSPLHLNALTKEAIEPFAKDFQFEEEEPKYILDLKDFKTHEDWLMTLKKNDRRDLRKDRNRILKQNPQIIFDQISDFEKLVEIAKKRFREKGDEADWEDQRRVETFRKVIELAGKSYQVRFISVKIGEKYAGVDLVCLFKERYYAVKCGYNVSEFKGIGNFVNLLEIDDALKLGLKKIDFLQNSYRWKSRWFPPLPLFKLRK